MGNKKPNTESYSDYYATCKNSATINAVGRTYPMKGGIAGIARVVPTSCTHILDTIELWQIKDWKSSNMKQM